MQGVAHMPAAFRVQHGGPGEREMARVAFVMEQTLGHVTHARNLSSELAERHGYLSLPAGALPVVRLLFKA